MARELAPAGLQSSPKPFIRQTQGEPALHNCTVPDLPTARLTPTLLIIGTNRHRLHRRFDQTQCDTQVMQPVLNFLFHRLAPFRVVLSD